MPQIKYKSALIYKEPKENLKLFILKKVINAPREMLQSEVSSREEFVRIGFQSMQCPILTELQFLISKEK